MAQVLSDFHNNAAEEKVYVAVGNAVNDSILALRWAIQRFSDYKFCILHVHQPTALSQEERDLEAIMSSKLDKYVSLCTEYGIQAEQVYFEMDSIEKGILELISRHKIHKLIMGAAADQHYNMKMFKPKSSKAIYVKSHAPSFCQIWFICKGNLVCTREAKIGRSRFLNALEYTMTLESAVESLVACQGKALGKLYTEELEKKEEFEAEVTAQKLVIAKHEHTIKQLEEKVDTYAELLKHCEESRDKALNLSRDLVKKLNSSELFLTMPFSEILKVASESDESSQLCEGELGNIYRAVLYHTEVTLRFLPENKLLPFRHEVKILSKFRHPNVAALIGACPETMTLVYENLPNGSLEDRLRCKGETRPLSWQRRIKIAIQLCSALIFLHSHGVIHGAIRPSCIFLDSTFTCKLIDFQSSSTSSVYVGEYTDPEFLDTQEISPKLDVYSFGLMLLELLTGKPGFSVVEEVKCCLDEGTLDSLLDNSGGEWSFLLAEQLAHLGLRCSCSEDSRARPDLKSDVWKVLEPMRLSTGSALSFRVGEAPSYFVCPIVQEVMEDPHVAADGYTYEAEALRQWLDGGNTTSPMTNLVLNNNNLVPNRSLRSAIQEWLQIQRH